MKSHDHSWRQVAAAMTLQMISIPSIHTAYSVIALALSQAFAPSNLVLMLGFTVFSLVAGLVSPVLGGVIDRFSLRRLMVFATLWLGCGFWSLSWVEAMWQVPVIYGVFMAPASVLLGSMSSSVLLARWFSRYRARALGIAASGVAVGGLLLPPFIQFLVDALEWRPALRLYSLFMVATLLPVAVFVVRDHPPEEDAGTAAARGGSPAEPLAPLPLFTDRHFWLLAITIGLIFCGPVALTANLMLFLSHRGIDANAGVMLLSLIAGANFCGKLLVAAVGDRFHERYALVFILALLAVAAFGFMQAQSYAVLVASGLLVGVSAGCTGPLWSLTLSRRYGAAQLGKAMGKMRLLIMPFTLSSAPLLGWVADQTGSYRGAFAGYIALALLGCIFIVVAGKGAPKPAPEYQ